MSLIRRARAALAGTLDAEHVLREHAGLINRIAHGVEANAALRDELRQEIALAVWQASRHFRGDSALRTYVARVAHNVAAEHVARHVRERPTDSLYDVGLPSAQQENALDAEVLQATIYRAMQRLPIALQQAVILAFEGFSQQEIAQTLGISVANAGVRVHRGRLRLRELMGMKP